MERDVRKMPQRLMHILNRKLVYDWSNASHHRNPIQVAST